MNLLKFLDFTPLQTMYSKNSKDKSLLGASAGSDSLDQISSPNPSEHHSGRHARKQSKPSFMQFIRNAYTYNRSSLYVLFVCLITYMFSQVDRYLQGITVEDMQNDQNWPSNLSNGKGGGYGEDLLVGAVFTVVYLPSGIPFGFLADRYSDYKKYILFGAFLTWSLATAATGFSTSFYQVMVFRFILAIGESACTPIAGSIISDHFSKETRTTALGLYNWGIYTGYSLANGAANVLTEVTNWRTVWWAFGFGGCVWTLFVLLIPQPHFRKRSSLSNNNIQRRKSSASESNKASVCGIIKYFLFTPSLAILLIASLIRNAGGYVWGYNAKVFFENVDGQSDIQQALYMQWIPLIGGCFGALFGGFVSDKYVKKYKSQPWKRLLILISSNLVAAPFAFLALWLPAPYCYLMLIPSNVIGEMWVGICIALVIELVPAMMKTTALSIYFFIIGIGGFFPLLVTPLQTFFCGDQGSGCDDGLQWTLVVLWPGLYVLSSFLFLTAMIFLRRDAERAKMKQNIRL